MLRENDTVGDLMENNFSVSAMQYDLRNEHITIKRVQTIDQMTSCLVKAKIAKLLKYCQLLYGKASLRQIPVL